MSAGRGAEPDAAHTESRPKHALRNGTTTSGTAIAVGDSPKDAVLLVSYSGKELPPEVKKLIDGS
ncbi:hypothetical protein [Streptomyces sp. NPDC055105]|uniref:hypothetical protein n=1 Tax=Streptomyces sp. NPDC055105 TaxID=3365719 RepID=UPI0037D6B560